MLKLLDEHSALLLLQPESGMGYQVVEATSVDDKKRECVVYNAELLIYSEELERVEKGLSYKLLLEKTASFSYGIKDLRVISSFWKFASIAESQGAAQSPIKYTGKNEIFKRFSAYEKDNRITLSRGLLPWTYATTEDDAKHVRTGMDAVARYALPNPDPAIYVFVIRPPEDTEVKRGIVQPANSQHGGGIEIIFTKGSPDNTVSLPYTIPPR